MLSSRNQQGLSDEQIRKARQIWDALEGNRVCPLDVSRAATSGSRTAFSEQARAVYLGADAYPSSGTTARSRMSVLACLAHELAHARRYTRGYNRPIAMPDGLIDEAETSLDASFEPVLSVADRRDLVEDARDQTADWLSRLRGAK